MVVAMGRQRSCSAPLRALVPAVRASGLSAAVQPLPRLPEPARLQVSKVLLQRLIAWLRS